MDSSTVRASIVATTCALLALASAPAMAAKPSGGGSTDPCAKQELDFPAFAFWRPAGRSIEILVADAEGKCIRSVIKTTGIGGTIQFSYPVNDISNRGRVVWLSKSAPEAVGVDFTVDALTKQVTVFGRKTIYSGTGGFISLSKDGSALYSTRYPGSGGPVVERVPLDATGSATDSPALVFQAPVGSNIQTISVNETVIFADYKPTAGAATNQLVVVPLASADNFYAIDSNDSWDEFNPAADPSSSRVSYERNEGTSGGCDALVTSDTNGTLTYPLQPAYGLKSTWVNGNVVSDGQTASCDYSGTIMQTNPTTGEQVALTRGYDPDGR